MARASSGNELEPDAHLKYSSSIMTMMLMITMIMMMMIMMVDFVKRNDGGGVDRVDEVTPEVWGCGLDDVMHTEVSVRWNGMAWLIWCGMAYYAMVDWYGMVDDVMHTEVRGPREVRGWKAGCQELMRRPSS